MANRVNHHLITEEDELCNIRRLSRKGINFGNPSLDNLDNGNVGSSSLNDETGVPAIDFWMANVEALRYFTVNTGP
jgi:hypothetical protein